MTSICCTQTIIIPRSSRRASWARYGHLSNEACGEALLQLYQTGVRHAVLGHLSHENNTPELAMSTVCGVLRAHGLEPSEDIQVDMAWRDHVGGVYEII